LFSKLKEVIKGTHFGDVEAIKSVETMKLKAIPEISFQEFTNAWKKRMEKCIRFEGDLFQRGKRVMFDLKLKQSFCDTSPVSFLTHLIYCKLLKRIYRLIA